MNRYLYKEESKLNKMNILNRVFSKSMIKELLSSGRSEIIDNAYEIYFEKDSTTNNKTKIEYLYKIIEKHYRNEYLFKNIIFNKLLLGRHSLNTTSALTELWINNSKADFVMFNGKATVYEIKTVLDNLDRLDNQLNDYFKVFDYVEIIVDEVHLPKITERYKESDVGISILTKRNSISSVKKPTQTVQHFSYESLYKILRKQERKNILEKFYRELPNVTQFEEFERYYILFKQIPLIEVQKMVLMELKRRGEKAKENKDYLLEVPYELKSLIYFCSFTPLQYRQFQNSMKE